MDTAQLLRFEYEEDLHPRGHGGKWTSNGENKATQEAHPIPGSVLLPLLSNRPGGTYAVTGPNGIITLECNVNQSQKHVPPPTPGRAIMPQQPPCIPEERAQMILSTVAGLAAQFRQDPPVSVAIVSPEQAVAAGCPGAAAYTSSEHVIHLVQGFPGVTDSNDGLQTVLGSAIADVGASRYVVMHEYGHADQPEGVGAIYDKVMALPNVGGLSKYGQLNASEAYAEAFADYVATGGTTTNVSTRSYAAKFRWGR